MDGRRRRRTRSVVGVVALAALASCTASHGRPGETVPTAAEVAALLEDAHAARAQRDALCGLASADLNCRMSLQYAPPAPERAPTLVCTGAFDAPEDFADGTLARVHGVDADGTVFDSTLLAITTGGGARFIDPVYWSPAGISTGSTSDPANHVVLDC